MSAWIGRNRRNLLFFPCLMLLVTLYVHGCNGTGVEGEALAAKPAIDCSAALGNYSIDCPALPDPPPQANASNDPAQAQLFEDFAWKSFVAINWPAIDPTSSTRPPYARGYPDYNTPFGLGAPDALPVWGAWKEKRELFSVDAQTPLPWNSEVDYFVDFPPCTTGDAERIAAMPFPRLFAQAGKGLLNSFDETVQVPSEARFPSQVAGAAVEPRLWRGSRADNNTVVYEVKLNWDYYTYVDDNQLFNDTVKDARAAKSGDPNVSPQSTQAINFPRRDSSYSMTACEQINQGSGGTLPSNPCPTGTIQTKSAWVLLSPAEIKSGKYHSTEAQFYRSVPVSSQFPEGICTAHGEFGLLGFHIIQKLENQGHYVYATWEHSANDATPFVYANYFFGNSTIPEGFYPAATDTPNAIKVSRMHPVFNGTSQVTSAYHVLIRQVNPSSVWLNYELIGVQFLPVQADSPGEPFATGSDDPSNIGQPFYLANLVIETNWGLQNFQGVPPGLPNGNVPAAFVPTQGFQNGSSSTDRYLPNDTIAFNRSGNNIGHNRRGENPSIPGRVFNMGGCMGCHGIAQANGSDFSFVLKNGQGGADVDTINGPP